MRQPGLNTACAATLLPLVPSPAPTQNCCRTRTGQAAPSSNPSGPLRLDVAGPSPRWLGAQRLARHRAGRQAVAGDDPDLYCLPFTELAAIDGERLPIE